MAGAHAAAADGTSTGGRLTLLVSYLDSAYTEAPGAVRLGTIIGHREAPNGSQTDMVAAILTFGIARRVEARLFVPYLRSRLANIYQSTGIGDSYLSVKLRVRENTRSGPAVAFQPTLEVLSRQSLFAGESGPHKYNVALPVIVQKNVGRLSAFGEAGYSTREVAFGGVGVYAPLTRRLGVCGTLLYSRATSDVRLNDEYGLGRRRADSGLSLSYAAGADLLLTANVIRTVSTLNPNATRYMVLVGADYRFHLRRSGDTPGASRSSRPAPAIDGRD
jgi:hypothetical protein